VSQQAVVAAVVHCHGLGGANALHDDIDTTQKVGSKYAVNWSSSSIVHTGWVATAVSHRQTHTHSSQTQGGSHTGEPSSANFTYYTIRPSSSKSTCPITSLVSSQTTDLRPNFSLVRLPHSVQSQYPPIPCPAVLSLSTNSK
jgi:hypothetical protein